MAAQFVTSDSEHDSEGASRSPVHSSIQSSPVHHSKSTPGQIFNDDNNTFENPFDDDFGDDPFAEDNPNNPFNNPFGSNTVNINSNYNKNQQNKRTDATQCEVKEKRSRTPEPEIAPIFNAHNNPNNNPFHQKPDALGRRHSQPVNSMGHNVDLDDIFSDFQPQQNQFENQQNQFETQQKVPKLPPKTNASQSLAPGNGVIMNDKKKRSHSVMVNRETVNSLHNNKRRDSVKKEHKENKEELDVAKKTGYDIAYFVEKDIAYKYLCIICENVCRNVVELTCKKKRHLCCEYCITKYFDIHGNKCPIHPEHANLSYSKSRYSSYHIESLKVKCPYATASSPMHGGCAWSEQLKYLDKHQLEHTQFVRCPFADYGCVEKLKIEESKTNDEALGEHLIFAQHQHLVLLLNKTKELSYSLQNKNRIINDLRRNQIKCDNKLKYLSNTSRIGTDNIWILCGSHKFWKHKYNQLFTVNLQNECKTAIRIYDIERVANNSNIKTTTSNGSNMKNTNQIQTVSGPLYDPTQSDSWDVGDLGVAHVNNGFDIPIWLMKKYPLLDVFNRDRYNSIIWRCGGHLIRDKKVSSRVDAMLLDNHYYGNNSSYSASSAIHMQSLKGYKLNCFPNLPSKRYNCECVYSHRNGLIVVGGSGVDKNQINHVNQLKIRDEDVDIRYSSNIDDDRKQKDKSYPKNNTFNITLEWKSLSPILRAREDTAICLFHDKNIKWKEYIIICGGWSNGCLRSSELYNFEANKWINLPPMNVKHNAAGITEWKHNNSIVIVGGFNTEAHFACEYFEMIKQKWVKFPNTNFKHRYKPAVWTKDTESPQIICCAGSGVLKNEVGTVEYLDTRDNKWCTVKKPLTKLLGLAANINANNWRMWRIFT